MPGNRVNIRLVVKPKSTPFVDPTPPKSTVVSKSGFPNLFKAVGIMAGAYLAFLVINSVMPGFPITLPSLDIFRSVPSTTVPGIGYVFQAPAETTLHAPRNLDEPISYGQTVTSTIYYSYGVDNPGIDDDNWTFNGNVGDKITIKMIVDTSKSDQAKNYISLVLNGPDGYDQCSTAGSGFDYANGADTINEINYCEIVNHVLTQAGTYSINIESTDSSNNRVTYNLTLTN